jgi:hypothetical protein
MKMYRKPLKAFWRAIELHQIIDRTYSPRIWEARRDIAIRVVANCNQMHAAGYLQPDRLPL